MRLSDLARAEAVSLPAMTQVVNRMVQLGWVYARRQWERSITSSRLQEGRKVAPQTAELRNAELIEKDKSERDE
jgi:DNA-binding MarR family transcriptional regulator